MAEENGLHKKGDWKKAKNVTEKVTLLIEESCVVCAQRLALQGEKIAKEHIQNQDLGWTPLKPATIANKVRKGYSELIYVATSTYFQSITGWNEGTTALIGVRRGTLTDTGGDLGIVAATLEFGSPSHNVPERPLWRPTGTELEEWCKKENDPAKLALEKLKKEA